MSAGVKIGFEELTEISQRISEISEVREGADRLNAISDWLEVQGIDDAALVRAMRILERQYLHLGMAGLGSGCVHAFLAGWFARELYGVDGSAVS